MKRTMQPHPVDLTMRNVQPLYSSANRGIPSQKIYNHIVENSTGSVHTDPHETKRIISHMFDQYPRLKSIYHRGFHPVQKTKFKRQTSSVSSKDSVHLIRDYQRTQDVPRFFANGVPMSNTHFAVKEFHLV